MANNFAHITFTGHVGKQPEIKFLANGTPILRFSVCCNTGYKDNVTASWYECSYFGKGAEAVSKFMEKGKLVLVAGEPSIRKYTSEAGKEYSGVNVRVNDIQLFGGRNVEQRQEQKQESSQAIPATREPTQEEIPF